MADQETSPLADLELAMRGAADALREVEDTAVQQVQIRNARAALHDDVQTMDVDRLVEKFPALKEGR
ncbi:hypothetical protein [Tessaracoccus sp. Z1128]